MLYGITSSNSSEAKKISVSHPRDLSIPQLPPLTTPTSLPGIPTHYLTGHTAPLKNIAFVKFPISDTTGKLRLDLPPPYILTAGGDGDYNLMDVRDGAGMAEVEGAMRCEF